jgi:hypothetical protein
MDDGLDDRLRELAAEYNQPPETPRDAMWQRIVAQRAEKADTTANTEGERAPHVLPLRPGRPRRLFRPLTWAAGIAAILVLGIGIGRLTLTGFRPGATAPSPRSVAVVPAAVPRVNAEAYRLVTTEYLSQSEAFLTLFRASVRSPGKEQLASATARQLLATNRLLLDSPAADDAKTRLLLQDLELVLAEIAQLSPASRSRDLDLITQGLEQGGVLSRLRTAVPAGTSATRGAL